MKSLKFLTYFFAAITLLSFTGCDKDDEDKEPSKTDLLTAATWTGSAIYANGMNISEDFIEAFGYDITKNTIKFDKAGSYADRYENQTLTGIWEFTNNEQAILFDKNDPDDRYTATITKLDNKELFLQQPIEFEDLGGNLVTVNLEVRYSR